MLRLLAEHEGYRYYLLLVDAIDTVTEWLPGPEHFSLFIYQDKKIEGDQEVARFSRFARSALQAGAKSVYCGGLMGSWLHDLFDLEEMFLKRESAQDADGEDTSSDDDDYVRTYFKTDDFDMDQLVWEFMSLASATSLYEPHIKDKVAVFQKNDPNWKLYMRSLEKRVEKEIGRFLL